MRLFCNCNYNYQKINGILLKNITGVVRERVWCGHSIVIVDDSGRCSVLLLLLLQLLLVESFTKVLHWPGATSYSVLSHFFMSLLAAKDSLFSKDTERVELHALAIKVRNFLKNIVFMAALFCAVLHFVLSEISSEKFRYGI